MNRKRLPGMFLCAALLSGCGEKKKDDSQGTKATVKSAK